jgi:alkylhydroperoxidase/carboxymuconolactone decarboxylase family protein YurZ
MTRLDELARGVQHRSCGSLDARTASLARVAALVAIGASAVAYEDAVRRAIHDGASPEEVVDTLAAVSTTVGLTRLVAASSPIARALDYDLDSELEGPPVS